MSFEVALQAPYIRLQTKTALHIRLQLQANIHTSVQIHAHMNISDHLGTVSSRLYKHIYRYAKLKYAHEEI